MKKRLALYMIKLMMIFIICSTIANAQQPEVTTLPDQPFKYFWTVKVKEWFSTTFEFDKEKLIEKRLELMEKRRIEFEKLAEKYQNISEEKKARLEKIIRNTEERRKRIMKKIQDNYDSLPEQKKIDVITFIEEHQQRIQEMKQRLEAFKQELQQAWDDSTLVVDELTGNTFVSELCGEATAGQITLDIALRDKNYEIIIPACICSSQDQCPDDTIRTNIIGNKVLDSPICLKQEQNQ